MRHVAFLRAINVGGRVVKMEQLRRLFTAMGFGDVSTFIASGNVIFESTSKATADLEKKISSALEKGLGYPVAVFIRSALEVAAIAKHQPYEEAELNEGSLFVVLLPDTIGAKDKKIIASLETPVDWLRVNKREIYWRAGRNFRDAQFSPARLEKVLGRPATFRNVTTMRKIAALLIKA
jgi:uncharacterized protein (DUF1697 family)